MTSYTVLTGSRTTSGSIANLLNDDRFSSTIVLTLAQQFIYQRLRIREMLVESSGTLSTSNPYISLPARFKAPYRLGIIGNASNLGGQGEIVYKPLDKLKEARVYDSAGVLPVTRPQMYSVNATLALFDTKPDKAYPYEFDHYAALAPLAASSNETNVLTDKYLNLLYNVCAAKAYEHLRRAEERAYHLQLAAGEILEANRDSDMSLETQDLRVEVV